MVPPGNHRRNQAERAIQTFKAHFISILAGVDDEFPLSLWCHLLESMTLTLNLLRQSKVAPKISAFAHVHGPHNYMKKPFAPLGCAIQAHVKPEDRRTWDTRLDAGFSLGTSMQHHRCFWVYITKTRATRISDKVFFKHQYITNPTLSPESHIAAAAQQLSTALKGNIPAGNETAKALKKVSKLFTKIAAAKNKTAKAKEQHNRVRATPAARQTTHLQRVEASVPRVAAGPEVDRCIEQIFANPSTPRPVAHAPATRSQSQSLQFNAQSSTARRPNYISQDEDNQPPPTRRTTRSASNSIIQEAMLSCMDIYKPQYVMSPDLGILNYIATAPTGTTHTITPQQMSVRRIPMTWFCKMANSVIGDNGEILEYCHLIANHATWATWKHLYGNKIGRLAQGMPGCNAGTNTIMFIKKNQVPQDRAKDMTCGLITTLIRPEKLDEQNRTRLVAGGDRVHYPGDAGTPTTDLLTVKLLLNSIISTPNAKFMTMDIKDFYLNTPMERFEYDCGLKTCQRMSSHTTNSLTLQLTMTTSTARSRRGCTAYHKLGSLPSNYSKNASRRTDTARAQSPQACGSMTNAPSASPLLSMTLESSMWEKRMHNTY